MKNKTNHDVRIVFQEPDGLFPIEGKMLTETELSKLIALMEDSRWIIIKWVSPQDYSEVYGTPSLIDPAKLSDETLRKIADQKSLGKEGFEDMIASLKN
jgi:hypothetical protein